MRNHKGGPHRDHFLYVRVLNMVAPPMNGTIHVGALTCTRALPEHVSTICVQEHYLPVEAQIAWRRHTRALSMLRSSACPWEHFLHERALPTWGSTIYV